MINAKYFQICDICGHERPLTNGQYQLIKANHLDRNIVFYIDDKEMRDVCPDCFNKISEFLKNVSKESENT